uniref:Phytoene dehydrogenase-related protein n=1 Tax=Candidatus Kentrum sp. FM TaxID=2126340 RepID=A0A450S2P6_9GAMM|nr:MAG: Phytoene dehydrogenase-related protein [Candidatus Kentron sp. FM]VFJ46017.1 MAG: Phytoene dehydrogenase-related protein [Candidatus Kentron sp. FM]VFK07041.1 MAG: Phytoene dehydrogenase-related protein [Candidatus Kentron sp. FM]
MPKVAVSSLTKITARMRGLSRLRYRSFPSEYDVLVIGAGLGGLATAVLLARMGYRILVLEKNEFVGGYASQVTYDGIGFDFGAQDITILGKEGMRIVRRLGIQDQLQPLHPHAVSIYPEHHFVWDSGSTKATRDYLLKHFPDESDALRHFFGEMNTIYREMDRYLTPRNFQPKLRAFPRLARYREFTAERFLREFFSDDILISLLSSYCLFYQGLPMQTLSALHFIGLLQSYFDTGAFYAKGGVGSLSQSMHRSLENLGVRFELNTPVNGIMIAMGRVSGASFDDGHSVGSNAVVSNIDPRVLRPLVPKPQDALIQTDPQPRVNHLSRCQLFAVLDNDALELPFVTFYATTYDKAEEYQAFVRGKPASMRIFCPPGGTRTLSIAIPAGFDTWQNALNDGKLAYDEKKEAMKARILELLWCAYLQLKGKVRVLGLVTPVDLSNLSGNLGGSLYGADAIPEQTGLRRTAIASLLPGLFLTGQWVAPGGSATLVLRGAALTAAAVDGYLRKMR